MNILYHFYITINNIWHLSLLEAFSQFHLEYSENIQENYNITNSTKMQNNNNNKKKQQASNTKIKIT